MQFRWGEASLTVLASHRPSYQSSRPCPHLKGTELCDLTRVGQERQEEGWINGVKDARERHQIHHSAEQGDVKGQRRVREVPGEMVVEQS